jgi:hypothetical protein
VRTEIHRKSQAKSQIILDDHFITLIDARRWGFYNFCAAFPEFRVKKIEIVHPNVSVEASLASPEVGEAAVPVSAFPK